MKITFIALTFSLCMILVHAERYSSSQLFEVHDSATVDIERLVDEGENWFVAQVNGAKPIASIFEEGKVEFRYEANFEILSTINSTVSKAELEGVHRYEGLSLPINLNESEVRIRHIFGSGGVCLFQYDPNGVKLDKYTSLLLIPDEWDVALIEAIDYLSEAARGATDPQIIKGNNPFIEVMLFQDYLGDVNLDQQSISNMILERTGKLQATLIYSTLHGVHDEIVLKGIIELLMSEGDDKVLSNLEKALVTATRESIHVDDPDIDKMIRSYVALISKNRDEAENISQLSAVETASEEI